MNFIDDLYDLMDESISLNSVLSIAQEAEDITSQAESDTAEATGSKKETGSDIDLNTNDILGTKTPDNQKGNTDESSEDDDSPGVDDSDTDGNITDDSSDEKTDINDDQQMNDKMNEMSDPFEASQKKKLWKQFKALHETFRNSVDLITKYVPNVSDAPTIKAMDSIKENLVTGKDLIYRILTEEHNQLSYPEMQKRYIGLNNIYDILTEELEEYFNSKKE